MWVGEAGSVEVGVRWGVAHGTRHACHVVSQVAKVVIFVEHAENPIDAAVKVFVLFQNTEGHTRPLPLVLSCALFSSSTLYPR